MLVDTSVWVDHLRRGNDLLASLLSGGEVHCHPFVIGELSCGHLKRRAEVLALLRNLPGSSVAENDEAIEFVEAHRLMGSGFGWVDVHLLASASLSRIPFWTLEKRLAEIARRLRLAPA